MKKSLLFFLSALMLVGLASSAAAMPILTGSSTDGLTWTATDASGRSALLVFDPALCEMTLTNLSTDAKVVPNEVLVGIFFTVTGGALSNPSVSTNEATIFNNDGSTFTGKDGYEGGVAKDDVYFHGDLNGEFGWLPNMTINGVSGVNGISSSAYDPLGFGRIDPDNYYNPPSPDGAEFGLVGTTPTSLPSAVTQYIQNSVTIAFDCTGMPEITGVDFLYGTDFVGQVPEPSTMLLFGFGLIGLAGISRRRFLKK